MKPELRMPLAQNVHLMVSVALHQLQSKGLLSVNNTARQYIDPTDFGLTGAWCPRVRGAAPGTPCEEPTLAQLLTHTSGLWDSDA